MQHAIVQTLVICIDLFVSGFAIFDLFAAVYDLNCVCVLTFHLQFYITQKAKSLGVNITFLKLKPTRSRNFNRGHRNTCGMLDVFFSFKKLLTHKNDFHFLSVIRK